MVIMHSAWPSPVSGRGASGFLHRAVGAGAEGRALVTGAEGRPVHIAFSPAGVLWISVSPESALGLAGLSRCGFPCSLFCTFRRHHCSLTFSLSALQWTSISLHESTQVVFAGFKKYLVLASSDLAASRSARRSQRGQTWLQVLVSSGRGAGPARPILQPTPGVRSPGRSMPPLCRGVGRGCLGASLCPVSAAGWVLLCHLRVLSSSFSSECFLISLVIASLTREVGRTVCFNLQTCGSFLST